MLIFYMKFLLELHYVNDNDFVYGILVGDNTNKGGVTSGDYAKPLTFYAELIRDYAKQQTVYILGRAGVAKKKR